MSSLPLPLVLLGLLGLCITLFGALGLMRRNQDQRRTTEMHQMLDDYEPDDGIIAVRKKSPSPTETALAGLALGESKPLYAPNADENNPYADDLIVLNIFPKEGAEDFQGFQLLQAVLSAGLRFGDMQIFHRYQEPSGKGAILFSLASATAPGTFDMEKIGLLSCPGLTLFMRLAANPSKDVDRFDMMAAAAHEIANELQGVLQDACGKPITSTTTDDIHSRIMHTANTEGYAA